MSFKAMGPLGEGFTLNCLTGVSDLSHQEAFWLWGLRALDFDLGQKL